ncbi:Protein kinase domain-containing protein [Fusarium falciforme]|uniref:Protein kinase domain-containing protein n=1 Tax=Fusarium falciforme TaxID=195108 RepID=UPI002301F331|nr:Protein kinase domain-containing protein [Fusarium falciforme]WAO90915.1 Protein kinase domain-containing protein [Fusarium falciforme]
MATRGFKSLRRPSLTLVSGARRCFGLKGMVPRIATRGLATAAQVSQPTLMEDHNARLISMGYTFNYIEHVENLEQYCHGGFHPVSLGETLNNRYLILNKLGHGGYSTVWLSWDILKQKYAALKIVLADFGEDSTEVDILQHLAARPGSKYPGKSLIRHVTDNFHFDGPNGRHTCLVNDPAMMSLRLAKDASFCRLFQPRTARAIAAQVVQALAYLHEGGVVHGDLHLDNVLLRLPERIRRLSPDQLHKKHSQPETVPVTRLDGAPLDENAPHHAVLPIWLGQKSEEVTLADARILLGDFGESYKPSNEKRQYCNAPIRYRAPEAQFPDACQPLSFSSDIWSLGCLIWGVMGQRPLFDAWTLSEDEILRDQTDLLGEIPEEWSVYGRSQPEYWAEEDMDVTPVQSAERGFTWEDRLERSIQQSRRENGMKTMSENEKEAFIEMMKQMITFRPEDRASARELLESRWMRQWALPEVRKTRSS